MKSYRILYHHRIRADDGQAVHVRELIGALRAIGHEVCETALVPKTEVDREPSESESSPAPDKPSFWQRLSLPRRAVELMEIAYSRQGARMLVRDAARFRPHFIYERHALHCASGLHAARELGLPLLLEVNSPMCDEMARLGLLRFPRRARRTERAVLQGSDRVLPVTEVLQQRLVECGAAEDRCRVIGNGGEPDRYDGQTRDAGRARRQALPGDAFVLGFVGYMRPWHRLDLALEAMAQPALARVHLVLIGEGPALPDVVARAEALRLRDRVHTMGVVPAPLLPEYLCMFDAALIPAINPYASPLKLFESLAAGVVTLVPDQPNLRERIQDGVNGILFEPESADSLVRKLGEVVGQPGRAAEIGAAGQRSLLDNGWTWQGNARRVVELYEELAS